MSAAVPIGAVPIGAGPIGAEPTIQSATRGGAPRLRLVAPLASDRIGRGAFAVIVVMVGAVGLTAILLVNTMVAQGAFSLTALKAEQAQLAERESTLHASIAALEAPAALESMARQLGMVPAKSPAFLRVSDGRVLGTPKPARPLRGSRDSSSERTTANGAG